VLAGKGKWGAYVAKHITPKLDGYRRSTVDALIAKADGKEEAPKEEGVTLSEQGDHDPRPSCATLHARSPRGQRLW
jgi:hypothetical protein